MNKSCLAMEFGVVALPCPVSHCHRAVSVPRCVFVHARALCIIVVDLVARVSVAKARCCSPRVRVIVTVQCQFHHGKFAFCNSGIQFGIAQRAPLHRNAHARAATCDESIASSDCAHAAAAQKSEMHRSTPALIPVLRSPLLQSTSTLRPNSNSQPLRLRQALPSV